MSNNGNPLYGIRGKSTKTYNDEDDHFKSVTVQSQAPQMTGNPLLSNINRKINSQTQQTQQKVTTQTKQQQIVKTSSDDFVILNNVNGGTLNYNNNVYISYPKAQPGFQDGENVNQFQSVQSEAGIKELYVGVLEFCRQSKIDSSITKYQKSRDNTWEIYVTGAEYEGVVCFSIDNNNPKNTFVEIKRLTGYGGFSFHNLISNLKDYLVNEKLVMEDNNNNNNNNNTSEDETKEEEPQFGFFAAGYVSSDDESDTE